MRPFNFPVQWGRLGNWPGTISPQAAMALLQEIAKLPKGGSIVEFRFDGGRTSAVIGWGCKAGGHVGVVSGSPSQDGMSEVWFNRLVMLFDLGGFLHREYAPKPYSVDMVVVNPGYHVTDEWRAALKPGGKIFHVGEARCEKKKADENHKPISDHSGREANIENSPAPPEIAVDQVEVVPVAQDGQVEEILPAQTDDEAVIFRLDNRPDGPVEPGMGGNGAGADNQALKADEGPMARHDGDGKGRRGPREGREKVVPEKGDV